MHTLSSWLIRKSTGWLSLLALLVFVLFTALVLPGQASTAESNRMDAHGQAVGSPDTSLFYSAEQLYSIAEAYGPQGRDAYIRARFTFDVIWPLVYTFFLLTVISYLGRQVFPADSSWQLANLLPLVGVLFDFLENFSTSLVMWRYPSETAVIAELAGVFTLLKWIFIGLSFFVLLGLLFVAIWQKVSIRKRKLEQM